jgi:hypothetical protein
MPASADVLILRDGQALTGKFQGGDQATINFLVNGQMRRYYLSEINSLTVTPTATQSGSNYSQPSSGSQASSSSSGPAYGSGRSDGYSNAGTTAPPASGPPPLRRAGVTVPSGTVLTVRMVDAVDSSVNQVGETFRATLDEPLVINGRTVASRGADATTKLTEVEQAGRLSGRSELALVLLDVVIDGRRYEITTNEVSQEGSSRGASTAKRVGGTAVVGAIIGGIIAGGKGAAQGAAAGAGAATAVQVLTHGEEVKIPAETRLQFTLANPIYM